MGFVRVPNITHLSPAKKKTVEISLNQFSNIKRIFISIRIRVNGSFILYLGEWKIIFLWILCVPKSIKNVWIMVFGHIEL